MLLTGAKVNFNVWFKNTSFNSSDGQVPSPQILYTSYNENFKVFSVSLYGGSMSFKPSIRMVSLNLGRLVDLSNILSQCHSEIVMNQILTGLNPTFIKKDSISFLISIYLFSDQLRHSSSILLQQTIIYLTYKMKDKIAYSMV